MVWHTIPEQDNDCRRVMIGQIVEILKAKGPSTAANPVQNGDPDRVELARKLEVAMYKASKSKEEYMKSQDLLLRVDELLKAEESQGQQKPSPIDVLKQRQERLLLLRHASKCTIPEGKCGTRHCAPMQKLWKHLSKCEEPDCKTPHCVSSRYVLSHYHRCQDKNCEVCAPVREKAAASKQQRPPVVTNEAQADADAVAHNRRILAEKEKVAIDPRYARGAKDGAGPSLPLSMTREDLTCHVHSLTVEQLQEALFPTLRKLMEHKSNMGLFNSPVDPVAQRIPDYPLVIKKPMDLGTVRRKLEEGCYRALKDFESDVKLTFDNAMRFNPVGNPVHEMAAQVAKDAERDLMKVREKMSSSKAVRGRDEKICQLCHAETCERCVLCERGCLSFEPKVLYCCGPCRGRVERSKYYYQPSGSSVIWCQDCYDAALRVPGKYVFLCCCGNVSGDSFCTL